MQHRKLMAAACLLTFVGIWIEKGMGLIVPGFIPSTLHEVVEYIPSLTEWKVTAGITAFGLLCFTLLLKIALPILSGWTPGMSVGIAKVDEQHRELFVRLNRLVAAIRRGAGGTELNSTVDFLGEYVHKHFSEEEELMAEHQYPQLESHRKLHAKFIADLEAIKARLASGDEDSDTIASELHLELRDWLVRHIIGVDKVFGRWAEERGIEHH